MSIEQQIKRVRKELLRAEILPWEGHRILQRLGVVSPRTNLFVVVFTKVLNYRRVQKIGNYVPRYSCIILFPLWLRQIGIRPEDRVDLRILHYVKGAPAWRSGVVVVHKPDEAIPYRTTLTTYPQDYGQTSLWRQVKTPTLMELALQLVGSDKQLTHLVKSIQEERAKPPTPENRHVGSPNFDYLVDTLGDRLMEIIEGEADGKAQA